MFGVQQAQGGPNSGAGQNATPQGAGPTDVEAGLLRARFQVGKLVEVYQRGVLERRVETVIESRPVTRRGANYGSVLLGEKPDSKPGRQCSNHCAPAWDRMRSSIADVARLSKAPVL